MDEFMNAFRLASRELFNNYFLKAYLADEDEEFFEQFQIIEEHLFAALVSTRAEIAQTRYGAPQEDIVVVAQLDSKWGIPIMLNRDTDSGYWDHDIDKTVPGCTFTFMRFFDWDQRSYADNRYVRVIVREWPGNDSLVGKQALIETHYVTYRKAS